MDILIELLKLYGWQALVVALSVFTFIELLKPRMRIVIKSTSVRHSVYTLLNYIFTLGFSALLSVIVTGNIEGLLQLYGTAIVVVNILYPIIANIGFFDWVSGVLKEAFVRLTEGGTWKKIVADLAVKIGVDSVIVTMILDKIDDEYFDSVRNGTESAEAFFARLKTELVLNIRQKLAGFVDNGKLQEAAEVLFEKLMSTWLKKSGGEK